MTHFQTSTHTARDGVSLRVFDRPGPAPNAPAVLLCNGLGGNLQTFRHLTAALACSHRVVSWDYRGLYGSALTDEQRSRVALGVEAHAADAVEVLDRLGVPDATLVGWSMGVQLGFEVARMAPERVTAAVALAGGYGRALSHTILGRSGAKVLRPGLDVFKAVMRHAGRALASPAASTTLVGAARALGLVHRNVDMNVFGDLLSEYVELDFDVYCELLGRLEDHDVEPVLKSLSVPVLVIAGDRDPMTPPWLSRKMHRLIPDCELVIIRGGSHYVPVEFPDAINDHVLRFLADRSQGALAGDDAPGIARRADAR